MRTVNRCGAAAVAAALTIAGAAPAGAAGSRHHAGGRHIAGAGVLGLSNPPVTAPRRFQLRIRTRTPRVSLFAGRLPKRSSADVRLGTVAVRHGHVTVTLPRRLPPAAYFVIACPARGRGHCAASRRATLVLPAKRVVTRTATPTLASSGNGSTTIGEAGGSVQTATPGRVTFTLTVPARSLPSDTPQQCQFEQQVGFWRDVCPYAPAMTGGTVTLTPLTALAGVASLGRFIAGVQLGPDGVFMIRGGLLTFPVPAGVPAKRLQVVGYTGDGSAAAPVPFRIQHNQVTVALGTLGGGVAVLETGGKAAHAATASAVAVAAARPRAARRAPGAHTAAAPGPDGFGSFYGQMLGSVVGQAHDRAVAGGDGSFTADEQSTMSSILTDWYNDIVTQEVPDGLQNDAAAEIAVRDLLDWSRTKALLGLGEGDVPGQVLRLLAGIYNRAQERCAQPHNVSWADMGQIITAYRDLVLAGHPDDVPMDQLLACMRLTVKFDSTITAVHGSPDSGTNVNEYTTSVIIKPNASVSALQGQGAGSYAQASGSLVGPPEPCGDNSGDFVSHVDELSGSGVPAQVGNFSPPSARIGGPPPMLELDLGEPTESYHAYNNPAPGACKPDTVMSLPNWFGAFLVGHKGEVSGTSGALGAYIFSLEPGTGATVATRTYDQTFTVKTDTDTEQTTITVIHTPAPYPHL